MVLIVSWIDILLICLRLDSFFVLIYINLMSWNLFLLLVWGIVFFGDGWRLLWNEDIDLFVFGKDDEEWMLVLCGEFILYWYFL